MKFRDRLTIVAAVTAALLSPGGRIVAAPTVLVMGDSISAAYGIQREQGWVALFSERLTRQVPGAAVINASVSGETTGGGLARLPGMLATHDPDVVVIELGGNDALRGYPVRTIRDNLSRMIKLAYTGERDVVVVGMQIPPNYGPRYTEAFTRVFEQVADEHDALMVPFLLENVALEPGLMQRDGIHPTADAQPLLLETFWQRVAPLISGTVSGD